MDLASEKASEFQSFNYSLTIKEHHLDTFAHVNNASYLSLLEEARWEFLNSRGFDLYSIQASGVGPVVLECHIKFLKELQLRQVIQIRSRILSYDKKIGIMEQCIYDENETRCCHANITFGLFDLKQRKLILPSEAWLHAIGIS